ncbi:hypothetical protein [Nonomuraea gerenzanensis]|uniref:Uncharacterized protein n=1 Tax=Nonomuraea gerenzanensis TaxID=93944 RepID=A0A1M4EFY5_9ACTN|nr:hypothetical protein [Nonomuraea gerenzanensis]UBU09494.1 hypothetical protein LCN96_34665 [Nonomuraea gerenzanensis]SBO97911.1 hypothetical protein BN4615_P7427 [Nonomuraea gerenzanensis]
MHKPMRGLMGGLMGGPVRGLMHGLMGGLMGGPVRGVARRRRCAAASEPPGWSAGPGGRGGGFRWC